MEGSALKSGQYSGELFSAKMFCFCHLSYRTSILPIPGYPGSYIAVWFHKKLASIDTAQSNFMRGSCFFSITLNDVLFAAADWFRCVAVLVT